MEDEEEEAKKQLAKDVAENLNKNEKFALSKEQSSASNRKRRFFDITGDVVSSKGMKKEDSTSGESSSGKRKASDLSGYSIFNPFDVDSIANYINKPQMKQEYTFGIDKVVVQMVEDYDTMGNIYTSFEAFQSTLSHTVQDTLSSIPFDVMLEKFNLQNKDAHITHLEKCGLPYLDCHKIHKFFAKEFKALSEDIVLKPILIATPEL